MSVEIFADLEQGTDEWLEARRGILTASTVRHALTGTGAVAKNDRQRALWWRLLAERLTGRIEEVPQTAAMRRGHLDEPIAREAYGAANFVVVDQVGFIRRDEPDWTLGFSPDGLVGDAGIIEIKSRTPQYHVKTVLSGEVPGEHKAQVQAGLLVTGREWCDYVSFSAGLPLCTIRVTPDPDWQAAIITAAKAFKTWVDDQEATWTQVARDLPATEYINHFEEEPWIS